MRRLCGLLPGVVLATVWSVPIPPGAADQGILPFTGLDDELSALRDEVVRLRAENAWLERLLELTPQQARPPGPVQTGVFDGEPAPVHAGSPASAKVAFYASLFVARPDVYGLRWENARTGRAGWVPAVRGGWRKGVPAAERGYLPLTEEVVTAHLSGELELGLYPLLDGDRCHWLAADFDGSTAVLDALAYLKAARAAGASAALEVSRSGLGAHVWLFFTGLVPAATARQLGSGLLREAIAVRGRMDLTSYDRLFPSQDVVGVGGFGNLIAAPLHAAPPAAEPLCSSNWPPGSRMRTSGPTCPASAASRPRRSPGSPSSSASSPSARRCSASAPPPPPRSPRSRQPWCTRGSVPPSPSKPRNCPQRCWPHSSTLPRCPTRSSTSASGAAPPPGTRRGSCATTTRRSPATCSCHVDCRTGSPHWSNRRPAAWSSPVNRPPAKRRPSGSPQNWTPSNSKPSTTSPTRNSACWSPRREPARRSWPAR